MTFSSSGGAPPQSAYEELRNPNLPWGYWLETDDHGRLVDEDGQNWASVRHALWQGRLRLAVPDDARNLDAEIERLVAVLAGIDRTASGELDGGVMPLTESVHDLMSGEWWSRSFLWLWMKGAGLIGHGRNAADCLTPEGRAVLVALAATRPLKTRFSPVGLAAMRALRPDDASEPAMAEWLDRVEAHAVRLPFRFERRELAGRALLALVGDGLGAVMPMRRTVWSQTFADYASRDRFMTWAAHRMDRWQEWGAKAYGQGGHGLTAHLFALVVADASLQKGYGSNPAAAGGDEDSGTPRNGSGDLLRLT